MADSFSIREANRIVKKHNELIKKLDNVDSFTNKQVNKINKAIQRVIYSGTIEESIDCFVNEKNISTSSIYNLDILTSEIYKLNLISKITEHITEINTKYKESIFSNIGIIKTINNPLKWFFSSEEKRIKGEEAFYNLQGILDSEYPTTIDDIDFNFKLIDNMPKEMAVAGFNNEKAECQQVCQNNSNLKKQNSSKDNIFSKLKTKHENVGNLINDFKKQLDNISTKIEERIDDFITKETLKLLKSIPLEELKKEIKIRPKILHDAGYESVYDIYSASLYRIVNIYGISETTAVDIKKAAKSFFDKTKATTKIRLNYDDKSVEATKVISLLYTFKQKHEKYDLIEKHYKENSFRIKSQINTLTNCLNEMNWLFYDDDKKEEIKDLYNELENEINVELKSITDLSSTVYDKQTDKAWEDFKENVISYNNYIEKIAPNVLGNDESIYGLPEDLATKIKEEEIFPDGLLCSLRRYQEWGVKYILHQEKVLLGDEMGLGKTIQAIASMVSLKNTGASHFIVVCPASVVTNWIREIEKHSKLKPIKIHGKEKNIAFNYWKKIGGVAVTTYETTKSLSFEDDKIVDMLIVDEAHYIKNPSARRTKNVENLCKLSKRLLFMTGTALENRVDEMINLIKILRPGIAKKIYNISWLSTAPQFREAIASVYYRRKREDVLTELPDLIETEEWCELSEDEEQIYEETVFEKNYQATRRVSWNVDDLQHSSKAKRLLELIEEATLEGRKILVFSYFLKTINGVINLLGDKCFGPIYGAVSPIRRQEIIDDFNKAPAGSVLIAQIQSGGTGLNIQSASVVIICEPQLKPSIENQAISRAYRMGQARSVLVMRLLAENTIDERIMEILKNKQIIFDSFADKSVAAASEINEISEKKFCEIIEEEIERIKRKNNQIN